MPEDANPRDDERSVRLRAEQVDPIVMYLIVRKATETAFSTVAADVARAARRCLAELREAPAWQTAFTEWLAGSFRKVALRADEKEWKALKALLGSADHICEGDVLCLPPRRRSACDRSIKRLQAYKGQVELPELVVAPGLNLAVSSEIEMSGGKALAQLAHGALMRDGASSLAVHVGVVKRVQWEELMATHAVAIVRDAGLTEVVAGSETVMAFIRGEDPA